MKTLITALLFICVFGATAQDRFDSTQCTFALLDGSKVEGYIFTYILTMPYQDPYDMDPGFNPSFKPWYKNDFIYGSYKVAVNVRKNITISATWYATLKGKKIEDFAHIYIYDKDTKQPYIVY